MEVKKKKRQGFLRAVISKLSCFCLKLHTQQRSDKLGWYLISIGVFGIGAYIVVWSLKKCTINSSSHFEAVQRICSANEASPSTVGEQKGSSTSPQGSKLQKRNLPPSRTARTKRVKEQMWLTQQLCFPALPWSSWKLYASICWENKYLDAIFFKKRKIIKEQTCA